MNTTLGTIIWALGGLASQGFTVASVDYPGYGLSDGSPDEKGCYRNVHRLYDWLVDGRPAGRGATFVWNVASSTPGIHEVRLVARVPQPSGVRLQGFARAEVEVAGDLLP